jgi:hypothetical protein
MERVRPQDRAAIGRQKGRLDQVAAPLAFVVFLLLWAGFALGLLVSQGSLDSAWSWITSLPLILQAVVWLLLLPVVFGLWVWHTDWVLALRLVVIVGVAVATLYAFYPRGLFGLKR